MLAHGRTRLLTRRTLLTRNAHTVREHKADTRWPGWEVVVGIEVHAQIKSRRKLFSGEQPYWTCVYSVNAAVYTESLSSDLTSSPNTHVVPFDAAFPGTLPVAHASTRHLLAEPADTAITEAQSQMCRIRRPHGSCSKRSGAA